MNGNFHGQPGGRQPYRDERPAPRPLPRQARRRLVPLPFVLAIDIFLIGAGLILFSLFHHVLPRDVGKAGIALPQYGAAGTELDERFAGEIGDEDPGYDESDDQNPGDAEPGDEAPAEGEPEETAAVTADPARGTEPGQSTAGTTQPAAMTAKPAASPSVKPTPTVRPTPAASPTPRPTPRPKAPTGAFAARFPGKFTTGAIEKTATSYRSPRINISVQKFANGSLAYSVADVYVSSLKYFRTAFATGSYGLGLTDSVLDIANRSRAVLGMSGDYYGIRDKGIVIRNGVLYRDVPYQDVLILNNDGSMQTFAAETFDINAVLQRGAWQGWSFGPMLLSNGKPMTTFNSKVTLANPRGAVGYYEPGHYVFVLVDGRQPGYSDGMTMAELSQLFYRLGCKVAYNLDGGESAVMTFQGAVFNQPYQDGRNISDILCIVDG